ncbi:hypothetical protein BJY04DRAFT_177084 [Aspergillus karnatakaensis]|uniref:uncharacterized protein n=1 Tax=Aspergillus karnatakaensis TaxID=1810916 RepID=UPI003CCE398B
MSRFSHSPQVPGSRTLAHFQLAKFSYCTTSVSRRGPLTWSHVFGNGDLSGGFEKYTTSIPGKIMFKVLRNDQDKLEELCMTDLLKDFESQAHPMQAGAKRPSFAVVVKVPCLAVKYPLKNGQVRRIQIKFSAQGDFYSVLALLSEINCPFSESDNNSAPSMRRPVSSISGFGSNDRTLYQNDRFSTSSISSLSSDASLPPYIHTTISRTPALSAEPDVERSRYINVSTDRLSSASSTTLRGSSRPLSSGTLNNPSLSPQETTHSKLDSLSASNKLAANETKQSKTFTGFHDASRPIEEEMSPPRTLPFAKKGTKRSRPSSDIAGASTSLTTDTGILQLEHIICRL